MGLFRLGFWPRDKKLAQGFLYFPFGSNMITWYLFGWCKSWTVELLALSHTFPHLIHDLPLCAFCFVWLGYITSNSLQTNFLQCYLHHLLVTRVPSCLGYLIWFYFCHSFLGPVRKIQFTFRRLEIPLDYNSIHLGKHNFHGNIGILVKLILQLVTAAKIKQSL